MADEVKIEVDGAHSGPTEIESKALLELAFAYVSLLEALATSLDRGELKHRGIKVIDKCTEMHFTPDSVATALAMTVEASRLVAGKTRAPRGAKTFVDRLQKSLRDQHREGRKVRVQVADFKHVLELPPAQPPQTPFGTTTLRATVQEAGGKRDADLGVLLDSKSEPEPFFAKATKAQCEELGHLLFKNIDVELAVTRNSEGAITWAEIRGYKGMDQVEDRAGALLAWVDRAGKGWEDVDDPMAELGRGD